MFEVEDQLTLPGISHVVEVETSAAKRSRRAPARSAVGWRGKLVVIFSDSGIQSAY
jgi:hypothetical protein